MFTRVVRVSKPLLIAAFMVSCVLLSIARVRPEQEPQVSKPRAARDGFSQRAQVAEEWTIEGERRANEAFNDDPMEIMRRARIRAFHLYPREDAATLKTHTPWDGMSPHQALADILDRNKIVFEYSLESIKRFHGEEKANELSLICGSFTDELQELSGELQEVAAGLEVSQVPKGSIVVFVGCMDLRVDPEIACGGPVYHIGVAGGVLGPTCQGSILGAFKLAEEKNLGVVLVFTTHTDCGKETKLDALSDEESVGLDPIRRRRMSHEVATQFFERWLKNNAPEITDKFDRGGAVALFAEVETSTLALLHPRVIKVSSAQPKVENPKVDGGK